jgi:hypothetical protein
VTWPPQDSSGRTIAVEDTVMWRGRSYTIKGFGAAPGRFGTRTILFEEPLHMKDEVPDEMAIGTARQPRLDQKACRRCAGKKDAGYKALRASESRQAVHRRKPE